MDELILPRIVLTGASGWIGRSILHQLQMYLSPKQFLERVIPLSSIKKSLKSTGYFGQPYDFCTYPLFEIKKNLFNKKPFTLIHTAFLTKDKISEYGIDNFIALNKKITLHAMEICKKENVQNIILISSGSARKYDNKSFLKNKKSYEVNDSYAFLKRSEEISFNSLNINCLILRVFALSGFFARSPNAFAMISFLSSAIKRERIHINSTRRCIRGYVSSSQLALAILNILADKKNYFPAMLNAVTDTTDLLSMASYISGIFNLEPPLHEINNNLDPDIYTANQLPFSKLLKSYNLKPMSLKNQIGETSNWLTDLNNYEKLF